MERSTSSSLICSLLPPLSPISLQLPRNAAVISVVASLCCCCGYCYCSSSFCFSFSRNSLRPSLLKVRNRVKLAFLASIWKQTTFTHGAVCVPAYCLLSTLPLPHRILVTALAASTGRCCFRSAAANAAASFAVAYALLLLFCCCCRSTSISFICN